MMEASRGWISKHLYLFLKQWWKPFLKYAMYWVICFIIWQNIVFSLFYLILELHNCFIITTSEEIWEHQSHFIIIYEQVLAFDGLRWQRNISHNNSFQVLEKIWNYDPKGSAALKCQVRFGCSFCFQNQWLRERTTFRDYINPLFTM